MKALYDGSGWESSYAGIRAQSFFDADKSNGRVRVPDDDTGEWFPKLKNGELVSLVMAWRRVAQRGSVRWSGWFDLVVAACGWRKEGDQFVDTRAHAAKWAPSSVVRLFWLDTDRLTKEIDGAATPLRPLRPNWKFAEYQQGERDAWEQMRIPPLPDKPPPSPIAPAPPVTGPVLPAFPWWLLVAAAYLITRKEPRR